MSTAAARIWGQVIAEICKHTTTSGEGWQKIKPGTATGDGNAGGTTLVDTNGDSGAADTYNGRYFVQIASGTCKGEERRVVDDDGAGILTVSPAFSAQIVSGVEYEIRLSPDPVVVCDGDVASTTQFNDDVRDEDDDDWKDYYAIPISGALVGEVSKVTAFDKTGGAGEGLFTVSPAFSAAPGTGDCIKLRKFVLASNLNFGQSHAYHPKPQKRVNFARGDGTVGAKGGTLSFGVEAQCSGALAASGSQAASTPLGDLLQAVGMEEQIDTSSTVGAGSSASAVKIATASWENHSVGGAVIYNGELRRITSLEDGAAGVDTVNVEPDFSIVPASGGTLYAVRRYSPSETGDVLGLLIEIEIDGIRQMFTGCKGNVSQGGDDIQMLNFDLQVDHYTRMNDPASYRPNAYYPSTQPVRADERVVYLDTTRTNVGGFTSTPGTAIQPKSVQGSGGLNGRVGYHIVDYDPGATFRELLAPDTQLSAELRWTARTAKKLLIVYGTHGNLMAVSIPVARMRESPHPQEQDALAVAPNVLEAQDAGTSTDGDSTVQKVPDYAIFIA